MIYREDYPDAQSYIDALFAARRRKIRLTVLTIAAVIIAVLVFWYEFYKVRHVLVEGNTRYSDEEIANIVESGVLGNNSLVLSARYRNRDVPDMPFIERMDVSVIQHDSIRISVYEMSLAGYVNYLGRYMYFSRDGTVVESSDVALSGVPEVLGLKFSYIALYEQLPVEDPAIFQQILNATQMLNKYELAADKIYFDTDGDMSIYFGGVRCDVGSVDYLDEKISNISRILPKLEGKKGRLELENFTPGTNYITFVQRHTDEADETSTEKSSPDRGTDGEAADIPIITSNDEPSADAADDSAGLSTIPSSDDDASGDQENSSQSDSIESIIEPIPEDDHGTVIQSAGDSGQE
ncbi:cell division protein FtsQ [Lachnospiraceae bacterium NK3A20]|jgi:hypothetical protein|nr:cell division protein FtsQ [Lachnospiraceae bacterium NK3A20]